LAQEPSRAPVDADLVWGPALVQRKLLPKSRPSLA